MIENPPYEPTMKRPPAPQRSGRKIQGTKGEVWIQGNLVGTFDGELSVSPPSNYVRPEPTDLLRFGYSSDNATQGSGSAGNQPFGDIVQVWPERMDFDPTTGKTKVEGICVLSSDRPVVYDRRTRRVFHPNGTVIDERELHAAGFPGHAPPIRQRSIAEAPPCRPSEFWIRIVKAIIRNVRDW